MKGIIFTLLEDFVTERFDVETYFHIVEESDLETKEPFVSPGTYPDADLFKLVAKVCETAEVPLVAGLRAFGAFCFPRLMKLYPEVTDRFTNAHELILAVDGIVHVEVHKIYPEAVTPKFEYLRDTGDYLELAYFSQRKMCPVMEGLIDGAGSYYNQKIEHSQSECMLKGDEFCRFHIHFGPRA